MNTVNQNVRCGNCGDVLTERTNIPDTDRVPCPTCGSLARQFDVIIEETLRVSSHLTGLGERSGEAISFAETQREGRISGASIEPDGTLRVSIHGTSPQGEEDTEPACRVLLDRLRSEGGIYSDVRPGSGAVDCVLVAASNSSEDCDVQVIRALISPQFWRNLGATGVARENMSAHEAVSEIGKSIALKANEAKVPRRSRAELVLALDATRLPGLGFDTVVREFRLARGAWTASLGFKAIWLVGPIPRLCWRLDTTSDTAG